MTVDEYISEVLYSPEFDEYTRNVYRFEIRGYAREAFYRPNFVKKSAEIVAKVLAEQIYALVDPDVDKDETNSIFTHLNHFASQERQAFPDPDLYS